MTCVLGVSSKQEIPLKCLNRRGWIEFFAFFTTRCPCGLHALLSSLLPHALCTARQSRDPVRSLHSPLGLLFLSPPPPTCSSPNPSSPSSSALIPSLSHQLLCHRDKQTSKRNFQVIFRASPHPGLCPSPETLGHELCSSLKEVAPGPFNNCLPPGVSPASLPSISRVSRFLLSYITPTCLQPAECALSQQESSPASAFPTVSPRSLPPSKDIPSLL